MVTAQLSPFGRNAAGETVHAITLDNGQMRVVILTRGGAIAEISVPDRHGAPANVVLTRADFAGWDRGGSFNTLVGRFAGRISGGGFAINGQFHALNADPVTGICSHGGAGAGWGTKLWTARPFEADGIAGLELHLHSPDGDNGFPGAVDITARYTLDAHNRLQLDFAARTTAPTHINVCSHPYFNLAGSGSADGHVLQLFASHYVPIDGRMLPIGRIDPVNDTPLDFRNARPLGPALRQDHPQLRLARGLDHTMIVDGTAGTLRPAAILADPASGRRLAIHTTQPALQVYSANFLDGAAPAAGGRLLRAGDGLALETQHVPDSPNHPHFPSTLLRPGEPFSERTVFAFDLMD
jgi:aldose 1-epimerase